MDTYNIRRDFELIYVETENFYKLLCSEKIIETSIRGNYSKVGKAKYLTATECRKWLLGLFKNQSKGKE